MVGKDDWMIGQMNRTKERTRDPQFLMLSISNRKGHIHNSRPTDHQMHSGD